MQNPLLSKVNHWIERILTYPGCDKKTLVARKAIWIFTLIPFLVILTLTIGFLIFIPQETILIYYYGPLLLGVLLLGLILTPLFPKLFIFLTVWNQTCMIIMTFFFILKLGGIANSVGLIFVGIASVLASIPLQNFRISTYLFILYTLSILLAGAWHPWLTVPAQLTPGINNFIFMLNILWMSAYLFYLVVNFIGQQKEMDEFEAKRLKELDETRSRLYTNITHEFRTPLTVIRGMANLIKTQPDQWTKEGTGKIIKNSDILLRLVNQMLALSKIETGSMPVRYLRGDMMDYLSYLVELFRSGAVSKNIELQFITDREHFTMDMDTDKIMLILSNLISNSLKFTAGGGMIGVTAKVDRNEKTIEISVKDTGIGIEPEHLPRIFDRFYQIDTGTAVTGSGLGLALAKEMAELLGGNISVTSAPGIGSEFTVLLPVSRQAPVAELSLLTGEKEREETLGQVPPEMEESETGETSDASGKPVLLIVEDNADVVRYLQAFLRSAYNVEVAGNGLRGYEKALELVPDIIISDVMMPVMDGIVMLGKIKNDIRTSHIPVVMLTAKADLESRLAGLEKGADAYIAKPFDEMELKLQLKNLVEIRRKLYERYAVPERFAETPDESLKIEDAFMIKVKQVLEANLEDDEFGINRLCHELAVSHTQLYRKFKSLSNKTIAEFFKTLRLHKARELLASTPMNVTQVTFAVGFKNLSHFSREFTREFGKSPASFKR